MRMIFALLIALAWNADAQLSTGARSDVGIDVHLSVRRFGASKALLREGDEAEVTVRLTDSASTPIAGAGVNGWFVLHQPGAPPLDHRECVARVATFTAGGLFRQPALDLNIYRVAVLNADPTISVLDPRVGFGGTSLLAMVQLAAPGEDWVLAADRGRLFVAMPQVGKVAVVDARTWNVIANVEAGQGLSRVLLQPDGGYLWAAYDHGVAAINPMNARVVARIRTGGGKHDLAVSDDNRSLFVTNAASGTTSVIDMQKLAVVRQVPSGANPVSVAWSALARAAYVVSGSDGAIVAIDPHRADPRARIGTEPGPSRIRFAPGARFAFITNPSLDKVYVLDASSNQIVQTALVEKGPFEVTFSDTIAYIRHLHSETVLMITLANAGDPGTRVSVADFPGGQRAFGATGVAPVPADGIVQIPGENAVLVTNPADGQIYYYREGMAAPSGDLPGYSHTPRATLVIDHSLREVKPGIFSTLATMPKAGLYDVALFVDSPRAVTCFQVTVGSRAGGPGSR
jgi:YVTN family beta-propeller protein